MNSPKYTSEDYGELDWRQEMIVEGAPDESGAVSPRVEYDLPSLSHEDLLRDIVAAYRARNHLPDRPHVRPYLDGLSDALRHVLGHLSGELLTLDDIEAHARAYDEVEDARAAERVASKAGGEAA